jgi:pyruvate dehydrogenase E1 component
MNENYTHPAMPTGAKDGILKGCTCSPKVPPTRKRRGCNLESGTIFREVIVAAELLKKDFGVIADIWSCPSFTELLAASR